MSRPAKLPLSGIASAHILVAPQLDVRRTAASAIRLPSPADVRAFLGLGENYLVVITSQPGVRSTAHASRRQSFMHLAIEGIWYCAFTPPIPLDLPAEEQVGRILRDGVLDECNDATARLYGLEAAHALIGSRIGDTLMPANERNREQLRAFVRGGHRLAGGQTTERDAAGMERHYLLSLVGIVENDQLVGVWGSQVDITSTRRTELQARSSETVAALNRLAGGVAHDFNNLLTTILTSVDMLEDTLATDDVARRDAMEIRRAARRGAELTRQLLALSQQQVLVPRPADLTAVVQRAASTLRRTLPSSVAVDVLAEAAPCLASVDSEELEQVLVNLGAYTAESMRNVGQVSFSVGTTTILEEQPTFPDRTLPGDYVTIAITDSAPPHGAADQAHLFEPFFGVELAESASGLALATLHGFARQSGATIVLESPHEGRLLRAHFRRLPPAMAGDIDRKRVSSHGADSPTVLIAEDEPTVRLLMKRVLQRAGYTVLVASDGEEALEMARSHGSPIDALVTDVIMPGMGGGELSRCLRREQPGIKVLHVSGYTAGALRHSEALEDGAAFMQKPFSPKALIARLGEVLAG
jgi:two-component system, cell cycle sensor histidine kinase and response regulator CckA